MATGQDKCSSGLNGPAGRRGSSTAVARGVRTGERPLDEILTEIERREIVAALTKASGTRTRAATLLGISRSRLYRRMDALGIDIHAFTHQRLG